MAESGSDRVRKQDLVRMVASETGQTENQAMTTVNAVFDAIERSLVANKEVTISGFGSFRVVSRAEREGRNPQTNQPMMIGARKSPAFRAGTQLKRAVGGE
ncbi:MAG: DNA-binding protein HU-beta [uncultured Thermomicrobiales bacterium]|uniref:DNA-binding protein HU-beta n=1 Tax=uncultured Thermomicrobiales bacterium TaxID=1645740 RepID=A0A6J4VLT0_9BACT|nr:MAG: DNA-binding protein HU-beta [uncultured Thermomicrobiales bacterium]